jgi:hypothetical protein
MKVEDGLISGEIGTGEDESGYFFMVSVFELYVVPYDGCVVDDSFFGAVGAELGFDLKRTDDALPGLMIKVH